MTSTGREAARRIVERDLTIEIAPELETCFVRVSGELDLGTVPALENELQRLLQSDLQRVILDLEQLEFIDSAGVGCLIDASERARAEADRLRILKPSGEVDRMLKLTGVREQLPVIES